MTDTAQALREDGRSADWRAWYAVCLLMLVYTSSFIDRTIIALLVGPIRADLQISDTQMSLLSGFAFALFYTTFGVPFGRLADLRSRRMIIAAGAATWSVMTAACGLAGNFLQLFLARLGVGIGEASLTPAAYSMITDAFPRRLLARAMGVYNIGISLGSGLALVFGGLIVALIGEAAPLTLPWIGALRPWQTVFLVAAIPGLILAALMLTVAEPKRRGLVVGAGGPEQLSFGDVVRYLWKRRRIYGRLYGGYSLLALVSFSFTSWIPTHFIRSYGWSAAATGQWFGVAVLIFGTAGSILGGLWADRLLRAGAASAYVRVALIACIGLFPTSILAPLMPTGALSLAVFCLWLVFYGAWLTICGGSVQLIAPNQLRGQATALMFLFSALIGWGLGPTAVALITDFVFGRDDALRYSMAIVGALAMPVAAFIFRSAEGPFAAEVVERAAADSEGVGRSGVEPSPTSPGTKAAVQMP